MSSNVVVLAPEHIGRDIVVKYLLAIRERHGLDVALEAAEGMAIAATAIIAREQGGERARKLLSQIDQVLLHA